MAELEKVVKHLNHNISKINICPSHISKIDIAKWKTFAQETNMFDERMEFPLAAFAGWEVAV